MPHDLVTERLETLLLARLSTAAVPAAVTALAGDLHRYAPTGLELVGWHDRVGECLHGLTERGVIDDARRLARADELQLRTGVRGAKWPVWSERILPALALGVRADDAKVHKRLADRDSWSAAIVARAHGLWNKAVPPTASQLCDDVIWRALGLANAAKRCPPEVRAHFLRGYIEIDGSPPDRMLRQLAAKLIGAPRAELKAFYPALIRSWLTGHEPGSHAAAPLDIARSHAMAAPAAAQPTPRDSLTGAAGDPARQPDAARQSLVDAARRAARDARDGVFGDRKVFISTVWSALRATPPWSALELDEFKQRLVAAHRKRELVLARADLVAAMDPALVAASETQTDGATFHFIVREPMQ
jgi:hypothetical protein